MSTVPDRLLPAGTAEPPRAGDEGAEMGAAQIQEAAQRVLTSVATVIDGKDEAARIALVVLLARGHLLIEDVPGVGKTVLAKALARSVDAEVRRIQFTPDLLPSDVTGVSVFDQRRNEFEFAPGPVFANIVIGDEINRASPKTQSALLECMEERQVTVDGTTYHLEEPFTVIATQNPIEMEGTYPLPEAQRDRFMARIDMGYPQLDDELAMLHGREHGNPLDRVRPCVSLAEVRAMMAHVDRVFVSDAVKEYTVSIVRATRADAALRLGASPRATLQLVQAAKAAAAIAGRAFVLPDDIEALAGPVLEHRLVPVSHEGHSGASRGVVERILATTRVPLGSPSRG